MTSPVNDFYIFRNFIFYDFNVIFPCHVFINDNFKKIDRVFSFNFGVIESNCRRMGQNSHQFVTLWNKTCLVLVEFCESLGVIDLWRPQKLTNFVTPHLLHPQKWTIELLLKNNRFRKNVEIFKTPFSHPPSMWTS